MDNDKEAARYTGARPDIVSVRHGDATVLLDPFSGRYYTLNQVGSFIWDRVCDAKDVTQIGAEVGALYNVSMEQAADDVTRFVFALQKRNLLEIDSGTEQA